MIAGLPMYDRAETARDNDIFWTLIRENLGFGPKQLTRDRDVWDLWQAPDLVLAQTCSLPYRMGLHGKVHLLGSPDFRLPGCPAGTYNSVIVARKNDKRSLSELMGARVSINQKLSQSGHMVLIELARLLGIRPNITCQSGGHANSVRLIAQESADLAAIDAMSWRIIRRHDQHAQALRVITSSHPTPAMPYITALANDPAPIRAALGRAIAAMPADLRNALNIHGLIETPARAYLDLPLMQGVTV